LHHRVHPTSSSESPQNCSGTRSRYSERTVQGALQGWYYTEYCSHVNLVMLAPLNVRMNGQNRVGLIGQQGGLISGVNTKACGHTRGLHLVIHVFAGAHSAPQVLETIE
jgi:hypothetical protein